MSKQNTTDSKVIYSLARKGMIAAYFQGIVRVNDYDGLTTDGETYFVDKAGREKIAFKKK